MLHYNFYYWGPFLFKIKVLPEDLKLITALCKKDKTKDARRKLAGIIKDEYFIDKRKYENILKKYLETYSHGYKTWYNQGLKNITCVSAWVNYMKQGEYNPPHLHGNCHLSSVLYLKIPEQLKKENKQYIGTVTNGGPGAITFQYGEHRPFNSNEHSIFPEEGDLYIFPFNLNHSVSPFKSNIERISVAANFVIE
jgi:uncharacterized protein (TIGR02466 family)